MKNKLLLCLSIFLFSSCKVNPSLSEVSSSLTSLSSSVISSSSAVSSLSEVVISSSSSSYTSSSLKEESESVVSSSSSTSTSISSSSTSTSISSITTSSLKDSSSSNEQFKFNEDLKYDDFYNELNKKNFTLNIEIGSRQIYEDESIVYEPSIYETIAIEEGIFYHKIDYIEESEYIYDTLEVAKIIDDKVHIALTNLYDNSINYYKIPLEAFYDTFINKFIATPFAYLTKSEEGGFLNSSLDFYQKEYSEYSIKDNTFNLEIYNYYFHEEFTNSEVTYYSYSNIGNTKINIDEELFLSVDYEDYDIRNFEQKGIEYSYYDNEFKADISLSYFDLVYVEKGAHTIYPEVYDIPVTTIYFPYYVYNKDFDGYEYNVYFNEELMYQADYSYIGEIKTSIGTSRYDAIDFFIENNGKFNYYGTW